MTRQCGNIIVVPAGENVIISSQSDSPSRGLRRWLLCPVVAGEGPSRAWGGGILWLNWQRRGDFQDLVRQTGLRSPFGWPHINAETLPAHQALIDAFLATPWISFDAFVVEPEAADQAAREANLNAFCEQQRRMLEDFVYQKIAERLQAEPDEPQPVRVWLDAKACGYSSPRAAVTGIEDHVLRSLFQRLRPEDKAINHRTARTPGLELGDLLLHAVVAAWQDSSLGAPKRALVANLCNGLGWASLRTASRPGDTKFNVHLGAPKQRSRRPTQLPLFEPLRSSRRPASAL